jgi:hypothetical protein
VAANMPPIPKPIFRECCNEHAPECGTSIAMIEEDAVYTPGTVQKAKRKKWHRATAEITRPT